MIGGAARAEPDPPPVVEEARVPDHGEFSLGVGYRTDDGFLATSRVVQPNLFGTGDLLAVDMTLSQRRQVEMLTFVDPHAFGGDVALGAAAYNDRKLLPGFWRDAVGGTTSMTEQVGAHLRGFLGYRLEQVHVEPTDDEPIARGGPVTPPPGDYRLGALRAGVEYSTLDARFLPTRGASAGLEIESADPRLGSQVTLTRTQVWTSAHGRIGWFILHSRASAAVVVGRDVPMAERLYLDGSSDVRGYAPGGIGPATGGTWELLDSAELELPVFHGLSVAGFVDWGFVGDWTSYELGRSTGFGLIWRSPLGPMRCDYAIPLGGGPPRVVFGEGAL